MQCNVLQCNATQRKVTQGSAEVMHVCLYQGVEGVGLGSHVGRQIICSFNRW